MLREICAALLPAEGLANTLTNWNEIAKGLSASKRKRKRHFLK